MCAGGPAHLCIGVTRHWARARMRVAPDLVVPLPQDAGRADDQRGAAVRCHTRARARRRAPPTLILACNPGGDCRVYALKLASSHLADSQGAPKGQAYRERWAWIQQTDFTDQNSLDRPTLHAATSAQGGQDSGARTWRAAPQEANTGAMQPGAARIALHPQPCVAVRVRGAAHAVHPPLLLVILAAWPQVPSLCQAAAHRPTHMSDGDLHWPTSLSMAFRLLDLPGGGANELCRSTNGMRHLCIN